MPSYKPVKTKKFCPFCGDRLVNLRLLSRQGQQDKVFVMSYWCESCAENKKPRVYSVRRRAVVDTCKEMRKMANRIRKKNAEFDSSDDDTESRNSSSERMNFCHDCGNQHKKQAIVFYRTLSAIPKRDPRASALLVYSCSVCTPNFDVNPTLVSVQRDYSVDFLPFEQVRLTILEGEDKD